MRKAALLILVLLLQASVAANVRDQASAHLTGGVTKITGKYKIQFLVLPKNPLPDENVTLNFSVQDLNSNNLRNVTALITIRLQNLTVFLAPRQTYSYGDFLIGFLFHQEGMYTLSMVVFDGGQSFPADFEITVSRLNRALFEISQRLQYIVWISVLLALGILLVRELRKDQRSRTKTKKLGVR